MAERLTDDQVQNLEAKIAECNRHLRTAQELLDKKDSRAHFYFDRASDTLILANNQSYLYHFPKGEPQ